MKKVYNQQKQLEKLNSKIAECQSCDLCQTRTQTVPGIGMCMQDVMIVGEAPGAKEDENGKPFVGRSGALLLEAIEESPFEQKQRDFFITNLVKCRPPENRNPKKSEIAECKKFLELQIKILNPIVLIGVGAFASCTLLEHNRTQNENTCLKDFKITKSHGTIYKVNICGHNRIVIPMVHPSYFLRGRQSERKKMWKLFDKTYQLVVKWSKREIEKELDGVF